MNLSRNQLTAALLFALTIPIVMEYRLSPGETPYWLFLLIFVLLVTNFFIIKEKLQIIVVILVIAFSLGSVYFTSIVVRKSVAPEYGVHDIILQLESATSFFLQNKNPYAVTYFGTPLEKWHYSDTTANPALFHFVMPPFYLLFTLPFYFISITLFGFFDGRLPLIFCFIGLLYIMMKWVSRENRALALTVIGLNPAMVGYFIEGRSDYFAFFFLVFSFWLLNRNRYILSAVILALAFGVKQSIWPLFPLYVWYLWIKGEQTITIKSLFAFGITISLLFLPFIVWDWRAFFNSTIFYLTSSGPNSYPIAGYGVGMLLMQMGIIENPQSYHPFLLWQIVFGLPVLLYCFYLLKKSPTVSNLMMLYGVFLFVFWYFSRYFNNSHLGYISSIFLVSYFITHEKLHIKK